MALRLALDPGDRLARPSKFKADDAIRDGSAKIASDLIASARKPSTAIEGDADEVI